MTEQLQAIIEAAWEDRASMSVKSVPKAVAEAVEHVISALVLNEPGVLAHVAGMFSARGFNIDSLVVGRTEDPDLSRSGQGINPGEQRIRMALVVETAECVEAAQRIVQFVKSRR